jgi:arginase
MLAAIGAEIADEIAITCPPPQAFVEGPLKNFEETVEVSERAAKAIYAAISRGEIALALGGDHSSAIGTIRGASTACKSLGVIYIDAHPDVNTDDTTATGNIHGMVAALAMGAGHPYLLGEKRNAISPANFLFVGLKDFDEAEIDFLRRESPTAHTMLDIAERGLSPVMASITALARKVDKVWISMDMDSIDKTFAPGVAMPNSAGFTAREILSIAQYIGKTCDVAGLDIVEMLPANDSEGKTAGLALELIARFLGAEYSWYQKYMRQYERYEKINIKA